MAPFGCQALLLKQVAEPKDRRLVQQPRHGPQRGELAEHGDVVQMSRNLGVTLYLYLL